MRGEDKPVSEIGGTVGNDGGGNSLRVRIEVRHENTVVGESRREVNAAFGVSEAGQLLDWGAQRSYLDHLRADRCLAPGQYVSDQGPAPFENGI